MDNQRIGINLAMEFIQTCEKDGLKLDSVLLFGSYAKNQMHEQSDIDLVLVSDQFIGNPFLDARLFAEANLKFPKIEAHPYSTTNFQKGTSFLNEIRSTAIQLK
jgi:predicted nucleotidyltransferase